MAVTFNDDIRRYPNLQRQAQQLAQLFAGGIGSGFQNVAGRDYVMVDMESVGANPYALNPELERILRGAGLYSGSLPAQMQQVGVRNAVGVYIGKDDMRGSYQYVVGPQGEQQPVPDWGTATGYSYRLGGRHPDRSDKTGYYTLTFDPSGALSDIRWDNNKMHRGWFRENMGWLGPMLVGGLALAGAGGLLGGAGLTGGASAAPAAQGASLGQELAREIAYGAIGEAPAFGYSELMYGPAGGAGGAAASDIAAAAGLPELGLAPQTVGLEGTAPISASVPSSVASPVKVALDAIKPYASLIGPATSLIGAATAQAPQMPQMPQNAGARIPGVEAPPEARGLDRQATRSPIVDVLNRNRRANRNRTQLTGPGGVNLESVKVGRNTLLGL